MYILQVTLYGCKTISDIRRRADIADVTEQGAEENIWTFCKMQELTGGWRKLHNNELRKMYSLANIIMTSDYQIGDQEIGGTCNTYKGDEKCAKSWLESLKGRDAWDDQDMRWKYNIKIILGNSLEGCGLDQSGSR